MSAERIRDYIDDAPPFTPEPPRPLHRELPPPTPYPVDALGPILAPAVKAIRHQIQAPTAICAQSILGAATLAVQSHADILLPYGQSRPLSEFFVSIAESGD